MRVEQTPLPGVLRIVPDLFPDDRGFFFESFNKRTFADHCLPTEFVQDNHSRSRRAVVRGLHFQQRRPQGKLVRVARGRVFDVAVDVRRGSPTFGRWFAHELCDERGEMLWIPAGFAHGFCVLSEVADVVYKCDALFDREDDCGILWCDPSLAIPWPVESPVVSVKDRQLPPIHAARDDLPTFVG
jgi:dTDP-4-dehydrorhamnose 3,5-epimerase